MIISLRLQRYRQDVNGNRGEGFPGSWQLKLKELLGNDTMAAFLVFLLPGWFWRRRAFLLLKFPVRQRNLNSIAISNLPGQMQVSSDLWHQNTHTSQYSARG